jgi:hypothetical protein
VNYDWYSLVPNDEPVTQGDIICDCPVVEISAKQESPYIQGNLIRLRFGIVMTQACDLEHGKVDNLTVCELVPLIDLLNASSNLKYQANFKDINKQRKQSIVKEFKQGHVLNHHLLNNYESESMDFSYHTVSLKETFTVPVATLNNLLTAQGGQRLRLLPPYREQLGQAYARVFMRVGYPIDLEIDVTDF